MSHHETDRPRDLGAVERLLAEVTADERRQRIPLPEGLAQRLRDLPAMESATEPGSGTAADPIATGLDCAAVAEQLAEDPTAQDSRVREHLDTCGDCRQLFGPLQQVATAPPRPLPDSLRQRLLAIPSNMAGGSEETPTVRASVTHASGAQASHRDRAVISESPKSPAKATASRRRGAKDSRPSRSVRGRHASSRRGRSLRRQPLPWFHDARKVAMVCYTLTVVVMGLAGDLPEHFRNASQLADEQATQWVASGGEEGSELTESVAQGLVAGVDQGRHWMRLGGEAWGRWVSRTEDKLRQLPIPNSKSTIDTEGESDGTTPANPS